MMHDDELLLTVDMVRALVAEQFPEWSNEGIAHVTGSGTVNRIYRVGRSFAARFPMRDADPGDTLRLLHQEASAMVEVATVSPFPSPRPVAIGAPGQGFPLPWSIQTWLPGHTATPHSLANSQLFADDLAKLIRALRTASTEGRRFEGHGRGGNLPDHDDWMSYCLTMSESFMDVVPLRAMWRRLRTLPKLDADVMSHGDLIPANLLIERYHLVGVLDTGGFAAADPALDLVAGWHLLDLAQRRHLRATLHCDPIQWKRGAAWALQQAMGLVWYYRTTNPVSSRLGLSTLNRLINDPDLI